MVKKLNLRIEYGFDCKSKTTRFNFVVLLVFLFFGLPFLLYVLFVSLFLIISNTQSITPQMIEGVFVGLLGISIIYLLAHIQFNLYPYILLRKDGLQVQVLDKFRLSWRHIKWKDILAVYPCVKFGMGELLFYRKPVYIIEIKQTLTPWHKQLGLMYGNGTNSVIVLPSGFPGSNILIEEILPNLK